MKNQNLLDKKKRIDQLFLVVKSYPDSNSEDVEIKAYLTYYLCVRVSAFLEDGVRTIFGEYADKNSQNNVRDYMQNKLKKFPNPTVDAIKGLAKDFSTDWVEKIKKIEKQELA